MSILKTTLIIASMKEEPNSNKNKINRLFIYFENIEDGLSPSQVLYLINSLKYYLTLIGKEEEMKKDYRLEEFLESYVKGAH